MISREYEQLWQAPDLVSRIDEGIEANRKSDAVLRVEQADGSPAPGARVEIEQVASTFLFGANLFKLGCYEDASLNEAYEQRFVDLFNAATIALYWRTLEPEQGKPRFAADSPFIDRRPPVDMAVAFCEKHALNMNGHPLVWDLKLYSTPDWLPEDPAEAALLWEKRIREIAQRYGRRIQRWDVVNEVMLTWHRDPARSQPMLENYQRHAFTWAQRHLPDEALLMINDANVWDVEDATNYAGLIRELIDDGARIDGIGDQFHIFRNDRFERYLNGEILPPAELLAALDVLARFELPVHISEITLLALANDGPGMAAQARVASDLYRLWFSHRAVHAITWWNVPDGGAVAAENDVFSGLITGDMQPKPAYEALHDLIHNQWRTRLTATADDAGVVRFRGFHGRYRAACDAASDEFDVTAGEANEHRLTLAGASA